MEALGFDLKLFAFQLVNFLLVFAGLTFLLHKPLAKHLDARRAAQLEAEANAAKLKDELAHAEQLKAATLEEARQQAKEILNAAKRQAVELEKQLRAEAEKDVERMRARAQADLEAERKRLRSEMHDELAEMVVRATEKILRTEATASRKQQVEEAIKELAA